MRSLAAFAFLLLLPAVATATAAADFALDSPMGAAPGKQEAPDAAWNGETWLVVWRDEREPGTSMPVSTFRATRVDAAGDPIDGAGVRITTVSPGMSNPNVAACGRRWIVVWEDQQRILAARLDESARLLDPAPLVISAEKGQRMMSTVTCAGETALVVWADQRAGDQMRHLYAARVDVGGGQVLDPKGLALVASDGPEIHNYPSVAWNGTSFLLAWQVHADLGRSQTIRGLRLGADLAPLDPKPLLLSGDVAMSQYPKVAASGDDFLVLFSAPGADWKKPEVRGARVSGTEVRHAKLGFGSLPKIAGTKEGWAVAWVGREGNAAEAIAVRRDLSTTAPRVLSAPPPRGKASEGWLVTGVDAAAGGDAVLVSWGDARATAGIDRRDRGEIVSARLPASLEGEAVVQRLSTALPRQGKPVLAADGDAWALAWLEQDGVSARVMTTWLGKKGFHDARGVMVSAEGAGTVHQGPAVAAGAGVALVSWVSDEGTLAVRIDAEGKVLDVPPLVVAQKGAHPSLAFDGTKFLVAIGDGKKLLVRSIGADGVLGETKEGMRGAFPDSRVLIACRRAECIAVWGENRTLAGARIENGVPSRPVTIAYERVWLPRLTAGEEAFVVSWNFQRPAEGTDFPDDVQTLEIDASLRPVRKPRLLLDSKKDERLVAVDWWRGEPTILWLEAPRVQPLFPDMQLSPRGGRAEPIQGGTEGDVCRGANGVAVVWSASGRIRARVLGR